MKCHYTYYKDEDTGKLHKIFIPGCWSTVHTNDIDDCTCYDITFASFEMKRYNEKLEEMQRRISSLESENKDLMQIIKELKK